MSGDSEQRLQDLIVYLRTIQKPNKPIESVGVHDNLFASGLLDSLAIVQIVLYLEKTYGIDISAGGLDPERLSTMASIVDLIDKAIP